MFIIIDSLCTGSYITLKDLIIKLPSFPALFTDRSPPDFTLINKINVPDNW